MELQQFITATIKAVGKGIQEGKEGNIDPRHPSQGVEFDLAIQFKGK